MAYSTLTRAGYEEMRREIAGLRRRLRQREAVLKKVRERRQGRIRKLEKRIGEFKKKDRENARRREKLRRKIGKGRRARRTLRRLLMAVDTVLEVGFCPWEEDFGGAGRKRVERFRGVVEGIRGQYGWGVPHEVREK